MVLAVCFPSSGALAFTPQTGHWWNPNESGSGYNIDVSNGVLVITIYSYKLNGDSEWYLAAGPLSADQHHFVGTLDKYRNGQCISCAYSGHPTVIGNDGAISIAFLSETSATLSLPGGRLVNIQPFFPARPVHTGLNGTYRLKRGTVDFIGATVFDTDAGNLSAGGTLVIAGNQITENIAITVNGLTISLTQSGTFVDYGAYLVVTPNLGTPTRVSLIERDGLLITEGSTSATGSTPPYAEIDQWEAVPQATAIGKDDQAARDSRSSFIGALIGAAMQKATAER